MIRFNTLLLFFLFIMSQAQAQGIEFFHGTWKEALAKAKEEDKLLFVDAYATWCGPCKMMAKKVFTQEKVGEYFNENFINLKLDMEKTDGRTFDSEYPVSAYPTLFFLAGDGTVVKKIKGAQKAEQLIEHGKKALIGYDRSGKYEERYQEGDRSYDLVYNYVEALVQAKKPHSKVFNEYYRQEPDISDDQMAALAYVAAQETDSKAFEVIMQHRKPLIKKYGEEAWDRKVSDAVMMAVDKAIEYDYPDLLENAIDIARKQMVDGGKAVEAEARMRYASKMNDYDNYVKHAKKHIKYNKNNGSVLKQTIAHIAEEHSDSPKSLAFAADCIDKVQKYGDLDLIQGLSYAKILRMADEPKKAKKIIQALKDQYAEDKRKHDMICAAEEKINRVQPVK